MSGAFELTRSAINEVELRKSLANPAGGALVTFEGWVRNRNDGRPVTGLEYECFETLALKEGGRILSKAMSCFDILGVHCVHRTGRLGVGELAVWVGVAAEHRDDAIEACRYVIDEVKHRVPIWKKEHYTDGDSVWVHCADCAAHHHAGGKVR